MNKPAEWIEIMDGFRGLRMAVHSDLAEGNAVMVKLDDLKTQAALGWLVYNRLVWVDGEEFKARAPVEARKMWLEQGPAKEVAARLFVNCTFEPPVVKGPVAGSVPARDSSGDAAAGSTVGTPADATGEPAAAIPHRMKPSQEELFP